MRRHANRPQRRCPGLKSPEISIRPGRSSRQPRAVLGLTLRLDLVTVRTDRLLVIGGLGTALSQWDHMVTDGSQPRPTCLTTGATQGLTGEQSYSRLLIGPTAQSLGGWGLTAPCLPFTSMRLTATRPDKVGATLDWARAQCSRRHDYPVTIPNRTSAITRVTHGHPIGHGAAVLAWHPRSPASARSSPCARSRQTEVAQRPHSCRLTVGGPSGHERAGACGPGGSIHRRHSCKSWQHRQHGVNGDPNPDMGFWTVELLDNQAGDLGVVFDKAHLGQ